MSDKPNFCYSSKACHQSCWKKQVKNVISWGVLLLINCCKFWFRDSARQGGQEVSPPARELWIKLLSLRIPTCSPPSLRGGGDPYSIVAELCVVQPWIFLQERRGVIEADCSGFSFPHCFPSPWCGGGGKMGTMWNQAFFSLASQWPMKHTWYLSWTPRTCSCKFFWAGVNYRFNAKNWHFRQVLPKKWCFFLQI